MKLSSIQERNRRDTIILEIKSELQVNQRRIDSTENILGIEERHNTGQRMETKYRKQENKSKRR